MIYLMHWRGCGGPAYQWLDDDLPKVGTPMDHKKARTVGGGEVCDGDDLTCGTCGGQMRWDDLCPACFVKEPVPGVRYQPPAAAMEAQEGLGVHYGVPVHPSTGPIDSLGHAVVQSS